MWEIVGISEIDVGWGGIMWDIVGIKWDDSKKK